MRSKLSGKRWSNDEVEKLKENYYSSKKSELDKLLEDRTWKAIQRKAERLGLSRKRLNEPDNVWEIQDVPNWFNGEIVSDGCVTSCGRYTHSSQYKEYILLLAKKFDESNINYKYGENGYFDDRTSKYYERYTLRTRNIFKNLRKLWYPEGKKIVPDSFTLNGDVLVHWIIGDGSISKSCDNFSLCTEGFGKKSIDRLKGVFREKNMKVSSNSKGNLYIWNKKQNKDIVKDMLDGNFSEFPSCYQYKKERLRRWIEN